IRTWKTSIEGEVLLNDSRTQCDRCDGDFDSSSVIRVAHLDIKAVPHSEHRAKVDVYERRRIFRGAMQDRNQGAWRASGFESIERGFDLFEGSHPGREKCPQPVATDVAQIWQIREFA